MTRYLIYGFVLAFSLFSFGPTVVHAQSPDSDTVTSYKKLLNDALSGKGKKMVSIYCGYKDEMGGISDDSPHVAARGFFDIDCPANQDCISYFESGHGWTLDILDKKGRHYSRELGAISLKMMTESWGTAFPSSHDPRVRLEIQEYQYSKPAGFPGFNYISYTLDLSSAPGVATTPFIGTPTNVRFNSQDDSFGITYGTRLGSDDNKCFFRIQDWRP